MSDGWVKTMLEELERQKLETQNSWKPAMSTVCCMINIIVQSLNTEFMAAGDEHVMLYDNHNYSKFKHRIHGSRR